MKKFCKDCEPDKVSPLHLTEQVGKLFFPLQLTLQYIFNYLKGYVHIYRRVYDVVVSSFFKLLITIGILKESRLSKQVKYDARLDVIIQHAKRINKPIKPLSLLGHPTRFVSTTIDNKKKYFEVFPTNRAWQNYPVDIDDKITFKNLLAKNKMPVAKGAVFWSSRRAKEYAIHKLSFPMVVKPLSGSLSKHTTCNIQSAKELAKAIKVSKKISAQIVVEQYIKGDLFRITLVKNRVVGACLRRPPVVKGDGTHTLAQLIHEKNQTIKKTAHAQRNPQPRLVPINNELKRLVLSQGYSLKSIIPRGKPVQLHNKITLSNGAETIDVTDKICEKNTELFTKVAKLCGLPVVGIDVIAQDLNKPFAKQSFAVLEANSMPYIDMHHFPTRGKPRNIAGVIWAAALSK